MAEVTTKDRTAYQREQYLKRKRAKALGTVDGQLSLFPSFQQSSTGFFNSSTFQPGLKLVESCFNNQNSVEKNVESLNMGDLVDEITKNIKEQVRKNILPDKKKSVWPIVEIAFFSLMASLCFGVLTQTVSNIDRALLMPVLICEIVAVFFSFSLSKMKGAGFLGGLIIVLFATLLSNFLIIKSVKAQGDNAILTAKNAQEMQVIIKKEIEKERAFISDLESRSRFSLAKERVKRVDSLLAELKNLSTSSTSAVDSETVLIQIMIRVLVSVALILCTHNIANKLNLLF